MVTVFSYEYKKKGGPATAGRSAVADFTPAQSQRTKTFTGVTTSIPHALRSYSPAEYFILSCCYKQHSSAIVLLPTQAL
ncbi:MAG: hypothetical protein M3R72_12875 [Bacteroidota bacterium]|nr:hypothetical protein [Bacteroidota bacterium]